LLATEGSKMNSTNNDDLCKNFLISLRKIIQAIDQHSINLKKRFGLTGPQLVLLQAISANEHVSVTQLSKIVSLSQATVTDITKRLEKKEYLIKTRSTHDKRKIHILLTEKGQTILDAVPPPLQEEFTNRFYKLEKWEQLMIESSFERVVCMMSAEDIDASPIMAVGSFD